METHEKQLTSEQIFSGNVIRLEVDAVELPNGNTATREVVRHNGGVCVLALDEEDNVLLVRQYRYPYAKELLELPAGKLEPGEDPAACGLRELEEETGYIAADYSFLGKVYPSPGYTDEVLYIYVATGLHQSAQKLDEDEFLSVEKMPFEKVVDCCLDGTIADAKSLVAVLKYNEQQRRG